MNKKLVLSIFLSLAMVVSCTLGFLPDKTTVHAATAWNNTANVSWIDSSKKIIAFAFDDGPISSGTSAKRILDTLEKYHMHATFFYQGNKVNNSSKAEIQRAFKNGNEVASHTWTHPDLTTKNTYQIQEEVNKTTSLLRSITGQSNANYLVRPPYLKSNQTVKNAINTPLITCSADSADWNNGTKQSIINNILAKTQDGAITLLHETYDATADAVEYLVPELIRRGYVITTVSELFKMKGKTMYSGQVYTSCPGANVVHTNPTQAPTQTATPTKAPTPTPVITNTPVASGITYSYKVTSDWGNTFQAALVVTNNTTKTYNGWTLGFHYNATITSLWGAELVSQVGNKVTITNPSWDATLAPGASITINFIANGTDKSAPTDYTF